LPSEGRRSGPSGRSSAAPISAPRTRRDRLAEWVNEARSLGRAGALHLLGHRGDDDGVRLARAFTGKSKLIRFKHHFHGWHDHMTSGYASHFDGSPTPGVLPGVAGELLLAEQNDPEGSPGCSKPTTTSPRRSSSQPAPMVRSCRSTEIPDRAA